MKKIILNQKYIFCQIKIKSCIQNSLIRSTTQNNIFTFIFVAYTGISKRREEDAEAFIYSARPVHHPFRVALRAFKMFQSF